MHYEIEYDNLEDPKTVKQAIKDTQQFIGKGKKWERLVIIISAAIASGNTMPQMRLVCSFAGIEGYPVYALCKYITDILKVDMPIEPEKKKVKS